MSTLAGDRRCLIVDDVSSKKLWLNDVDYTTDERPLNHELDEQKVSLKSGSLQSGIL